MAAYFSNFPTIRYKSELIDTNVKNIMVRGILRDEAKKLLLETIEINSGDRSDQVAHLLYRNSEMDYLFYLLNDIIDPYYEWYLTEKQFNEYLYNTYNTEIDSIRYYREIKEGDDFNYDGLIVNIETYELMDAVEQALYEAITNREYENDLNYQRRLFNAIRPESVGLLQSQMKKLLSGQGSL